MIKKLLLLDIDETLVYSTENALERSCDFQVEQYFVYVRPYLDKFLNIGSENYDIAIWTSSSELYAEAILAEIIPFNIDLKFVFSREQCTQKFHESDFTYSYTKNLKKLKKRGYQLENVLMIDDTPRKLEKNYGNLIIVKEYKGDLDDDELIMLSHYLRDIANEENFRKLEKRYWREKYMNKRYTIKRS